MQTFFFLRHNGKFVKIHFHDIVYAESCKNYVKIITTTQNWMVLMPMKQLEEHLPASMFCRVHRSYIVSLQHIVSFDNATVDLKYISIPVGEQYRTRLQGSVNIIWGEGRTKMTVSESGIECVLEEKE